MRKASKIIGIVLVFVILLTMVFIKNDKEKLKTIKSEKQLLKIFFYILLYMLFQKS